MLVRRFDWIERILRLESDDRFFLACQSHDSRQGNQTKDVPSSQ